MIEYKPLKGEDYDRLTTLWTECGIHYRKTGRDSRERIEKEAREKPGHLIGAFDGEELIGCVIVTDDGRKGEICRLAVKDDYRRRGIASELVKKCEKVLEGKGTEIKFVTIERNNSVSLKLFEKLGYEVRDQILYVSKKPHKDA